MQTVFEQKDQLVSFLDHIPDGVTVQDMSGSLVYANNEAARLIGFKDSEELIRTPIREVMKGFVVMDEEGKELPLIMFPGRRAMQTKKGVEQILQFVRVETGETRWSLVKAQPILDEKGEVVRVVNLFHDLTDLKLAERKMAVLSGMSQALSGSVDFQRRLNGLAKVVVPKLADWCMVDLVDNQGEMKKVVLANKDPKKVKLAKELFQKYPIDPGAKYGVANVLRTGKAEFYPLIDAEMIKEGDHTEEYVRMLRKLGIKSAMLLPLVTRGKILGVLSLVMAESGRIYTKDDLKFAGELAHRAALLLDNARLYEEVVKEYRQIKRYEARLKENESKFKSVFDNALDVMVITDDQGAFLDVNPAGLKLFGLTKAKLQEGKLSDYADLGDEKEQRERRKDFKKRGSMKGEINVNLPGGKTRTVEYSATAEFLPGKNLFVLRDVTDRKQQEKRRDDFLGVASHELKTPLATVKAYAQLLYRSYDKWEKEKVKLYLSKIDSNADKLAKIVYDLLDVTRIREGRLELNDEVFDFDDFVNEIVADMKQIIGNRKIIKKGNAGGHVVADKARLAQVLTNLVRNAVNYSPGDKEVVINTMGDRNLVRVCVQDFGIGINPEESQKVFELFYRGNNYNKSATTGMGVGLYISSQIVKQYGGKMWAEGEEGKGSSFYFELPRKRGGRDGLNSR